MGTHPVNPIKRNINRERIVAKAKKKRKEGEQSMPGKGRN
jgi:hypothetical protein